MALLPFTLCLMFEIVDPSRFSDYVYMELSHEGSKSSVLAPAWSECVPCISEITESQNDRGWKGPLWVI